MNKKVKDLLINIIVAICSALITFFSSCTITRINGNSNSVSANQTTSLRSDSLSISR